jgi:hypothetical protein
VATSEEPAVDQVQEQLEAARLAIVSLLAVMTDEQLEAVETAMKALAPISDTASRASEELQVLRGRRLPAAGKDEPAEAVEAIEQRLTKQEKSR